MTGDSNSIEYGELRLNSKPTAALRYSYIPSDSATTGTLVLFINGLLLPQTGWEPTMKLLVQSYHEANKTRPALLAYDRFGQGKSDPDPADEGREDGNTHDLNDVVHNLYEFLEQVYKEKGISISPSQGNSVQLMFVCNSIGCPIARLFAQEHPATVSAFLFLDSMMTDTDFVSLFPNPDAADFDQDSLPSGITVDDVRKARQVYGQFFHPTVSNQEGLDRSNVSQLLPYSYTPKLAGPRGWGPLLTVVGHDWDFFAAENKVSRATQGIILTTCLLI